MKSKLKSSVTKEISYPVLKRHNHEGADYIVLFTAPECGTVVWVGMGHEVVGNYSWSFIEEKFQELPPGQIVELWN